METTQEFYQFIVYFGVFYMVFGAGLIVILEYLDK